MNLRLLRFQNIRAFEDLTLQLDPHFTVIAGKNGTGKTTLLTTVARIMQHWTMATPGQVIKPSDERVVVREGDGGIPYKIPFSPNTVEVQGLGPDNLPMEGSFDTKPSRPTSLQRAMATRKDQWFRAVDADPRIPLPLMAFFSPYRSPPPRKPTNGFEMQEPQIRRAGYDGAFDLWANYKNVETWFRTFDTAAMHEGTVFPAIEAAREAIAKLLPQCTDVRFYPRFNRVMIKNAKGHLEPLDQLSDGYRTIATLVGELAWRATTLNPTGSGGLPANVRGLVLIDELDIHLHPSWQRVIVSNLRAVFPNVQFITTTHSPFIIQSMRKDEVINLDSDAEQMDYWQEGIEDIAVGFMGVGEGNVPRSKLYRDLECAAEEYYRLLDHYDDAHPDVVALRQKLDDLEEYFTNDPGIAAMLRSRRLAEEAQRA